MANPLLSIIIPVYNASESIKKLVDSILIQDFSDFELILVDDGSTDDSLKIIREQAKKDERIIVISKKNGGPSSARNAGLKKSRGKYIQFFDSDDSIMEYSLQKITEAMKTSNAGLVVSGWQIDLQTEKGLVENYKQISPQKQLVSSNLDSFILESIGNDGLLYNLWNKLFLADIIKQNNLRFNEDIRFGEDLIFSLEYFKLIDSIQIIPDITYRYTTNSQTSVFSKSALVPEFRHINDRAIVDFIGNSATKKQISLRDWVRWRWLVSFWMMIAASELDKSEKVSRIEQFKPKNIQISNYVSLKKVILEELASFCLKNTKLALYFAYLLIFFKQSIKQIKLFIKR